jgi:acetyl/propionyl-CoA carboxylase alpha subunit
MNTRLQVEHPVTEAITGIDLVEWQIQVAAGLPLPATQADIRKRGHAIEARIAAERPELGYQPATGRIARLSVPRGVRFDTGIADGSTVGVHYDSMVAKLIVHGEDRATAVGRLDEGLAKLAILGVGTNIGLLRSCVSRPAFVAGTLTTDFLAAEFPDGWLPVASDVDDLTAAAAIAWVEAHMRNSVDPWRQASGFRVMSPRRPAQVELVVDRDGAETAVTILGGSSELVARMADGTRKPKRVDMISVVEGNDVMVSSGGLALHVQVGLAIERAPAASADTRSDMRLSAPLPGIITAVFAAQGARVRKGDTLVQMEAMKLVHTLKAPSDGVIGRIHHAIGETVATGATLIEIIPLEGD